MPLLEKISVIWILYIINTKVLRCSFKGIINFTVDIIIALTLPAETPRPIPCPAELWNDWGEAWVGDLFNCWEAIHLWSGTDILRSTHHYWQLYSACALYMGMRNTPEAVSIEVSISFNFNPKHQTTVNFRQIHQSNMHLRAKGLDWVRYSSAKSCVYQFLPSHCKTRQEIALSAWSIKRQGKAGQLPK